MNPRKHIPGRSEVPAEHKWNLSALYPSKAEWENDLTALDEKLQSVQSFRGRLGSGATTVRDFLDTRMEISKTMERLGFFAMLSFSGDQSDPSNQDMQMRFQQKAAAMEASTSWVQPELMAIDDDLIQSWLKDEVLSEYRIYLEQILRFKPHTLSEAEERILAMQSRFSHAPDQAFQVLTNVDLKFPDVETPEGPRPVSNGTLSVLLQHPERQVRRDAYHAYFEEIQKYKTTLAALYNGSVQHDIFQAQVNKYDSARQMSLFPNNIPETVYDSLITAVRQHLPVSSRYKKLRAKALGLDRLSSWDMNAPLFPDVKISHTYEQAVDVVMDALQILGEDYTTTLRNGLLGGWVDRYESQGKSSGAFSAGSFVAHPFIMLNHQDDDLRSVFTLAHEGGHAMHSHYSVAANPFQHYRYSIFVAEVASTFNEQLLAKHLLDIHQERDVRAHVLINQINSIMGTVVGATQYAEYEHEVHRMVEQGNTLTAESLLDLSRRLAEDYDDPAVSDMSPLRPLGALTIPHFYRAFYYFQYATGMSAAIALSQQVLKGGEAELAQYLRFLSRGGSSYPIDQLKEAGVDMTTPAPVEAAMQYLDNLVEMLEQLLG